MGWIPDHIFYAQKARKGGGKGGGGIASLIAMLGGGGKGKGKGKGKDQKRRTLAKVRTMDDDCKVWVGGMADRTTWKELETHMEANGGKPSLTEIMSKGTGVCAFKTAAEAAACIAAANGTELKGSTLEVDVWVKKEKA